MPDIAYIILLTIAASFIQRTTGFGFGIFIMTMLPFLMPSYGEATTLSGLLALTTSSVVMLKMWRLISWKRLMPVLLTFILVSSVAVTLLKYLDDRILRHILGFVLILVSLYFVILSERIHIRPTIPAALYTGTLSGILGGFFGMQGPPVVLYFLNSEPDRDHYMAIAQGFFVLGNLSMTITRACNGFFTSAVLHDYVFALCGIMVGTWLGGIVYRHIPTKIFRYVVYGYIGVSGVILLLTV